MFLFDSVAATPYAGADDIPARRFTPRAVAPRFGLDLHVDSRRKEGPVALIIEDNELVRTSESLLLRHRGFTVLTANDGAEGVKLFQEHQDSIDLVITDHSMPEKNGSDVRAEIAAMRPDIPIILVSSSASLLAAEDLADFAAVIQKPFDANDFINTAKTLSGYS